MNSQHRVARSELRRETCIIIPKYQRNLLISCGNIKHQPRARGGLTVTYAKAFRDTICDFEMIITNTDVNFDVPHGHVLGGSMNRSN